MTTTEFDDFRVTVIGERSSFSSNSVSSHSPAAKLLLFTRYPRPGSAKTRLIPRLGADGAAELQRQMTRFTVQEARKCGVAVEVCYWGGERAEMEAWLGAGLEYSEQGDGDLGRKLNTAFARVFQQGVKKVLVIGADCPELRAEDIRAGFDSLDKHDWVLGPAKDGGYYLLGMRRFMPELFSGIDWGSNMVLQQTLKRSTVKPYLLPDRADVDQPEDIPPRISVIIPALNESGQISRAIASAQSGFGVECIVVDGGSTDDTREKTLAMGAGLISEKPGRAGQMNSGAAASSGEILLFLHADSELPPGWDTEVRKAAASPDFALGAFRFKLKEGLSGGSIIEKLVAFRCRFLKKPYGDQALFASRNLFKSVGGFPEIPLLEDCRMVSALKKKGRVVLLEKPVLTSSRRWAEQGLIKTTLVNQIIIFAAFIGVSPQRLAGWYRPRR